MGEYNAEAEEITKSSRLNSGWLIILRINELWKDTHKHSRIANYSAWNSDLDRIWCELASDIKAGSEEDKTFKEFNQKIGALGKLKIGSRPQGFRNFDTTETMNHTKQYQILMEKEIFLRRLMNEQGKGTAYKEDEDDWE